MVSYRLDGCAEVFEQLFSFLSLFIQTIKLIEFLIKSVDEKRWMSYKFTALVEMLRKVDKETLIRIWDRCYNDDRLRYLCFYDLDFKMLWFNCNIWTDC